MSSGSTIVFCQSCSLPFVQMSWKNPDDSQAVLMTSSRALSAWRAIIGRHAL